MISHVASKQNSKIFPYFYNWVIFFHAIRFRSEAMFGMVSDYGSVFELDNHLTNEHQLLLIRSFKRSG